MQDLGLVGYQWSWERWGISLELHGRTWTMTWRELGPQSQRLPLVATLHRYGLKSSSMRKVSLLKPDTCPGPSEACQRPSGWSRGGMGEGHVVRWDQNITFWYKHSLCLEEEGGVPILRTPSQPGSMGVEQCFGGCFSAKGTGRLHRIEAMYRKILANNLLPQ